ncbi:hypothetical protein M8C21_006591 [Ambrosia artemisiifolia]|uniref:Clp R domain-containing protein n=1 Tax=Ambrosia artemisiifolia TaxID=4212 RepID=A0AAD5CRT4_AMBAR|nr:hypothetical protein M8C21_006591 [Ambrosia artemisiifolia]
MPTPVSSANEYLTEEAACALYDAVSIARKRSHSKTTSLHALSALLNLKTSILRDACSSARTLAPRLQFRALELCVSVSLDRLPASKTKTLEAEPPVSNSLMAAIKRAYANQRRHSDTFHLYQMQQYLYNSQYSLPCVKVELKHFILSILDDPIVIRVLGDGGFRCSDLKMRILPPLGVSGFKRIGSVLVKKGSRNPLLIGVSGDTVVTRFLECLKIGKVKGLPDEIEGLDVENIKEEIRAFGSGVLSKDMMGLKLKEVKEKVESCKGCGVIVNIGDLKAVVDGGLNSMEFVVEGVRDLVRDCGGKVWLIGYVGSYDVYMKVLAKFASLEKDWDLNLLPITSSDLNADGSRFKSSLMGSFLPFYGIFPAQTELETASHTSEQSMARCDACNEKCEQEVSVSVADQQSMGLTSWLRVPESDSTKGNNVVEGEDDAGVLNARVPFLHYLQPDPNRAEFSGNSNQEINLSTVDRFVNRSSSTTSITTDLGLGTVNVSPDPGPRTPSHESSLETFHRSVTGNIGETSKHVSNEKDFKQLYRALADKVGYQYDSIRAISQTITRVRAANQRRHVWFLFSGPDPVCKRKICTTLADVVFSSQESLISIDLNMENQIPHRDCIFSRKDVNLSDPSFRGKTVIEFIAEELAKKSRSVVLLEHIDKADFLTKDSLFQAIKTGKLTDARGRETSITDAIFVFTTSSSEEENVKDLLSYSEERILNAKALQMRIMVENTRAESSGILLSPKGLSLRNPETSNKRKITETVDFEIMVPKIKKLRSCFDLNLPLEETEESDNEMISEAKEAWLDEFLDQFDEKVVFEPFDFDSRAEAILKEICKCFEKSFGSRVVLEIENEVIVQILASCWLSDGNGGVEDWIETVLCKGFMEVMKYGVDSESMVKLVTVEGVKIEEHDALCVCLPSTIIVK